MKRTAKVDEEHMGEYGEGGFVTVGLYVPNYLIEQHIPELESHLLMGSENTLIGKAHITWPLSSHINIMARTEVKEEEVGFSYGSHKPNFKISVPGKMERAFREDGRTAGLFKAIIEHVRDPISQRAARKYLALRQKTL